MKVHVTKELNIKQLYDNIRRYGGLAEFDTCAEAGLLESDYTPRVTAMIFAALAEEAERRAKEGDD